MKKIILASLLFSLATLVNAVPTGITLSETNINENLAIGTTIGTATATGGTGPYAYDVIDEGNTSSFGVMLTQVSPNVTDDGVNNFKVRPAGGNNDGSNDITIATINFNSSASAENPATKLADAINTYNTANNSGVSATGMNASGTNASGTVRLDSWPANLDGATLIGFSVEADGAYITINSGLTISTPPTSDFFSIGTATGVLTSKVEFDYEAKASYTIVIRATDNTGGYLENFIINIGNIDDVPTPIDITLSPTTVAENNAAGTTVGNLATLFIVGDTGPYSYTVSNANPNKTFTFTVTGEDGAGNESTNFVIEAIGGSRTAIAHYYFHLYRANGQYNPANILSFEINQTEGFSSEYTITGSYTGTITLTDWPDKYDGATLIGSSRTDIDYITIDSGLTLPNYLPFSIEDGKLITTAVLDQATQSSYTITISSTDSSSPTAVTISKDFTITIATGGTVTGITLAPNTINNQAADGTTVGLLSTNATDTGRVYVLENNTATFSISGDKLTANNPGSLTASATYTVSISTLNGDNTIFTQSLTVTVTTKNIVESLSLSSTTVAENNAAGTTVGILATAGGTGSYTYTVGFNASKTFSFDVGAVNNNNSTSDNAFIVRAIDGVTDINIATYNYSYQPFESEESSNNPAAKLSKIINIFSSGTGFSAEYVEGQFTDIISTFTGTVRLTGWPDFYDGAELIGTTPTTTINYITIISTNKTLPNYSPFLIDGDKLITTAVLDKATLSSYTITINSTDANDIVVSRDFIITVADSPSGEVTEIFISKDTITNQAANGATVGFLYTNADDTGRVYVLENNTATFSISDDKLTANNPGSLTASATYTVRISTLNVDNTIFTQSLTITVTEEAEKTFSLDVDGNQTLNATNDGLIIFKYLLNPDANNLHTTIANDAIEDRKTSAQLKAYLDDAGTILDVDSNGSLSSSNDGLVIFKYLLNPNSNNLHTTIANNALEGRKTTAELKAYLDSYIE